MADIQGQTVLFTDRNNIIKRTSLGGNVSPEKIVPFIYLAQNKQILPMLGSKLYYKLQDDIKNNTLSGDYKILVENFIFDVISWATMVEALPFISYNIGDAGITKFLPENAESISRGEIDYLLTKSMQSSQFYAERLRDHLIANSAKFPEYNEGLGTSETLWPDKGSQYNVGWNLN